MPMVQRLLQQIALLCPSTVSRVVVTHNIPEAAVVHQPTAWPFKIEEIFNAYPQGFGRNHNCAFKKATEDFFCVMNPDVKLISDGLDVFAHLILSASQPRVGCAYPIQLDESGKIQDSERSLPTLRALWDRRILKRSENQVDWVNAACILLPKKAWLQIQGFDERYFMYCEDVDICLRLQLNGWHLEKNSIPVIHTGQRASHRHWKHFFWHLRSLIQLWTSESYKKFNQNK